MQVDAYAARHGLKGIPRRSAKVMDTIMTAGTTSVIALLIVMLLHFKREPRVLRHRAAAGLNQLFSGNALDAFDHQQIFRGQRPHLRQLSAFSPAAVS
jgi:hypothetical protein